MTWWNIESLSFEPFKLSALKSLMSSESSRWAFAGFANISFSADRSSSLPGALPDFFFSHVFESMATGWPSRVTVMVFLPSSRSSPESSGLFFVAS